MVLRLKPRKSRSPPGPLHRPYTKYARTTINAGWSSPVARQAHNLKVIGSNPIPATRITPSTQWVGGGFFWVTFLKKPPGQPSFNKAVGGRVGNEIHNPFESLSLRQLGRRRLFSA